MDESAPDTRSRRQAIAIHFAVALVVCVTFTVGVHTLSQWLEGGLLRNAPVALLEQYTNVLQFAIVLLFAVVVGAFIHRYPEPYFILWFFGWLSWVLLYLFRLLQIPGGQIFNALNSYFFLAAGVELTAPHGGAFDALRRFPQEPSRRFGDPALWLLSYVRNNPRTLFLFCPVAVIASAHALDEDLFRNLEGSFSILSILLVGIGLYRRMGVASAHSAIATLLVHAVYLEPQIARMLWAYQDEHRLDYLLTVLAPSLILKPVLALFVVLFGLREQDARRQHAETLGVKMLMQLPDGCILVKDGKVVLANARAVELLRLRADEQPMFSSIFCSEDEEKAFLNALRRGGGSVFGHDTEIRVAGQGTRFSACLPVRLDAMQSSLKSGSDETVVLMLDRHPFDLATAVYVVAHDYVHPRVRALMGRLKQMQEQPLLIDQPVEDGVPAFGVELGICQELHDAMDLLRREFRNYWGLRGEPESADVNQCIQIAWAQAVWVAHGELGCEASHQYQMFPDDARPIVCLSDKALQHTLINAYKNAVQATHRAQNRRLISPITTSVVASEGWVQITIRDSGKGFSDSILRFINDNRAPDTGTVGMGLVGLKLTMARVGGVVRVGNNERQSGAWLEMMFPIAPQAISDVGTEVNRG